MKKLIFGLGVLLATNNMLAVVPSCGNPSPPHCSATLAPSRNQETLAYNCGPLLAGKTPNTRCVNLGECLINGESVIQCFDYTPPTPPACLPIGEFCTENSQCCNNQCFGSYCYDYTPPSPATSCLACCANVFIDQTNAPALADQLANVKACLNPQLAPSGAQTKTNASCLPTTSCIVSPSGPTGTDNCAYICNTQYISKVSNTVGPTEKQQIDCMSYCTTPSTAGKTPWDALLDIQLSEKRAPIK